MKISLGKGIKCVGPIASLGFKLAGKVLKLERGFWVIIRSRR